jgi:hypothetical protein
VSNVWVLVNPVTGAVGLFDEYDLSSDRDSVGDDLRFALRAAGNQPELDLSGLQFADSCLVNVLAEIAREGIRVHVKNPPRIVTLALDVTGVSDLVGVE